MKLNSFGLALSLFLALGLTGCGQSAKNTASPEAPRVSMGEEAGGGESAPGHSHDGWWCDEHGVPEEVCAQCNSKVAADFKAKGDWCDEHSVPESQCFVCNPEFEEQFAAQYEAKYGRKPPKRDGAGEPSGEHAPEHGHDHKT